MLEKLIMFEFVKDIFRGSSNKNPSRDSSKTGLSSIGKSSGINKNTKKTWICKEAVKKTY
jgi:hypothetical protein